MLFDCREPYSYAASDGLEFTWLLFNGLNARAFYQKILQARGRRAFSPAAPAEIAQMLDSLRSACAEDARLSEARCSQQRGEFHSQLPQERWRCTRNLSEVSGLTA